MSTQEVAGYSGFSVFFAFVIGFCAADDTREVAALKHELAECRAEQPAEQASEQPSIPPER